MANLLNRCMFRAASGGSGDFVVASAETGARTPTEAGAENGQTYSYVAESDDRSQVAFGTGTWNSGTSTLVRGTEEFIGSGFAGNFSAAPRVMLTPLAEDFGPQRDVLVNVDFSATPMAGVEFDFDVGTYNALEIHVNDISVDEMGLGEGKKYETIIAYLDEGKDVVGLMLTGDAIYRVEMTGGVLYSVRGIGGEIDASVYEGGGILASVVKGVRVRLEGGVFTGETDPLANEQGISSVPPLGVSMKFMTIIMSGPPPWTAQTYITGTLKIFGIRK